MFQGKIVRATSVELFLKSLRTQVTSPILRQSLLTPVLVLASCIFAVKRADGDL